MSILLALALVVAPPQIDVLADARNICPLSFEMDDAAKFVSEYTVMRKYNLDQKLEMLKYCLMFSEGYLKALQDGKVALDRE